MSNWYVIRLKPGATREPKRRVLAPASVGPMSVVEQALMECGIGCYLPRLRKEFLHHRTRQRVVKSFPLFTGYAFAQIDDADQRLVRECDGVASVLGLNGEPWPVPARVIDDCRMAEAEGRFNVKIPRVAMAPSARAARAASIAAYPMGSRVRATDGAFAGFHGYVQDVVGRGAVRVAIDVFGRLTPVEFEPSQIAIVEAA